MLVDKSDSNQLQRQYNNDGANKQKLANVFVFISIVARILILLVLNKFTIQFNVFYICI